MKHEPREESHPIRACAELVLQEAQGHDGKMAAAEAKKRQRKLKTRAEIRKEEGRMEGRGGGQKGKERDCRAPRRHKSPSWELSLPMNHLNS